MKPLRTARERDTEEAWIKWWKENNQFEARQHPDRKYVVINNYSAQPIIISNPCRTIIKTVC